MEIHGSRPYSLMFGRQANGFEDSSKIDLTPETESELKQRLHFLTTIVFPVIHEKVKKAHMKRNEYFEKIKTIFRDDFPEGAQVMIKEELRKTKSEPAYEGPFSVVRRQKSGNYLLKAVDGTEYVRPPSVLKLVAPEIIKDLNLELDTTLYAAVDKIIAHRDVGGKRMYLVHWKDKPSTLDSWLNHSDFMDYGPVQAYERKLNAKAKRNATAEKSAGEQSGGELESEVDTRSRKRVRFARRENN